MTRACLKQVARALGLAFPLWVASCSDGAHAFLARTWNDSAQCLDVLRAIDVMNGSEAVSGCAVRCLRTRTSPSVLYVTSMCDPNPPSLDFVDGSDEACAKAVAAWNQKTSCGDAAP